jgi:hypothetical protein
MKKNCKESIQGHTKTVERALSWSTKIMSRVNILSVLVELSQVKKLETHLIHHLE